MKWTDEVPTEPGYYWFRGHVGLGHVLARVTKPGEVLLVSMCGYTDTVQRTISWRPKCQWAGPIPEPKED